MYVIVYIGGTTVCLSVGVYVSHSATGACCLYHFRISSSVTAIQHLNLQPMSYRQRTATTQSKY